MRRFVRREALGVRRSEDRTATGTPYALRLTPDAAPEAPAS